MKVLKYSQKIQSFPKSNYVYFLINDSMIVYVGSTNSPQSRIGAHHKDKKFEQIYVREIKNVNNEQLRHIEGYYIYKFKPKYNKVYPYNSNLRKNSFRRYFNDDYKSLLIKFNEQDYKTITEIAYWRGETVKTVIDLMIHKNCVEYRSAGKLVLNN